MNNVNYDKSLDPGGRFGALVYLLDNVGMWPAYVEDYIGPKEYYNWRFIKDLNGEIYFANCIEQGISEEEFMVLLANELKEMTVH